MDVLPKLVAVFGLAIVELWAAVPAGFALGLPPAVTALTAAGGAMTGALVVAVLGNRARAWLLARHSSRGEEHDPGPLGRIWERYGAIGLGLLAPLLVGAPIGTALGLALGAPIRRLLLWVGVGIVLWSVLLTGAGVLGLAGLDFAQG